MAPLALLFASFVAAALAQQQDPGVISDTGKSGAAVEIVHLYYDEWPTGKSSWPFPADKMLTPSQVLRCRVLGACFRITLQLSTL